MDGRYAAPRLWRPGPEDDRYARHRYAARQRAYPRLRDGGEYDAGYGSWYGAPYARHPRRLDLGRHEPAYGPAYGPAHGPRPRFHDGGAWLMYDGGHPGYRGDYPRRVRRQRMRPVSDPYDDAYHSRQGPWPRAYDAPPPEERRRRWTDREEWRDRLERIREGGEDEEGFAGRVRGFVRRYRDPIIGLAMAGAAAPVAQAARAPARAPTTPEEAEQMTRADIAGRGTIEEELGEEWAESEAEQIRADTIEGAMVRYGISRDLAEDIYDAAVANDIDPDVAFGLVNTESTFDERAVSHVGARGLTQVMPRTGAWLRPGTTAEDLFNRELNLDLGFGYLRDLIDMYDGNLRLALLAYNRGPGTVDRVLERGGDPDNGYADKVLSG